jgi:hypothetical protein
MKKEEDEERRRFRRRKVKREERRRRYHIFAIQFSKLILLLGVLNHCGIKVYSGRLKNRGGFGTRDT